MPVAGKVFTKKLELPGYPDDDKAYVTIITNPRAEVWDTVDTTDPTSTTYLVLSRIIDDWNFTDDTGKFLPVTPDTVKSTLSILDIGYIMENLGLSGLTDPKKN